MSPHEVSCPIPFAPISLPVEFSVTAPVSRPLSTEVSSPVAASYPDGQLRHSSGQRPESHYAGCCLGMESDHRTDRTGRYWCQCGFAARCGETVARKLACRRGHSPRHPGDMGGFDRAEPIERRSGSPTVASGDLCVGDAEYDLYGRHHDGQARVSQTR